MSAWLDLEYNPLLAVLDPATPITHGPRDGISVHAVVGDLESSEFQRQNSLLGARWGTSVVSMD